MEKFWSFAKWILIGAVIFMVLGFGYTFLERTTSIFSTIGSWFNSDPIIIDAFKDAPTNYIGYTKEEIKNQTSEETCPSLGDIECKIYMQDYLDVVVFYKEVEQKDGTMFYPNLLFLKTEKGLVFDGCLNLSATSWGWFGEQSFEWEENFGEKPKFDKNLRNHTGVILSSGKCPWVFYSGLFNGPHISSWLNKAQSYIIQNLYPHFLSFYEDNIKIYQGEDTSSGDFNAFYTYLYESAKLSSETQCFVDVTDLTFWPIAEADRVLYPRTPTSEDDSTTYLFFDCNVFMQVFKERYDIDVVPSRYDESIEVNIGLRDIEEIDITPSYMPVVTLKLWTEEYEKNLFLATLEHMEALQETPITFNFYLGDELRKQVVFDGTFAPSVGKTFAITKGNYIWEIESAGFVFSSYTGTQTISKNGTITHNFTYMDGAVQTSFRLHPASIECSEQVLSQHPAVVNISGPKNFQFSFYELETVSLVLDRGTYTYAITSEYLSFSPQTGTFEVTAENHDFKFIYYCEGSNEVVVSFSSGESAQGIKVKIYYDVRSAMPDVLEKVVVFAFLPDGTIEEFEIETSKIEWGNSYGLFVFLNGSHEINVEGLGLQFKLVFDSETYGGLSEIWTNVVTCDTYFSDIAICGD